MNQNMVYNQDLQIKIKDQEIKKIMENDEVNEKYNDKQELLKESTDIEIDYEIEKNVTMKQYLKESLAICLMSLSISFSSLSNLLVFVVNLYYISKVNEMEIYAAAGLCQLWTLFTSEALIYGMNQGFCNLAAKAYGARQYEQIGVLYKKGLIVLFLFLIYEIILGLMTRRLQILFGQDEELSELIQELFIYMIPGMLFLGWYNLDTQYLSAQNITGVQIPIQFGTMFIHIFFCQTFIYDMKLKLFGLALAVNLTYFLNFILYRIYMCWSYTAPYKKVLWTSKQVMVSNWRGYFNMGVPIALSTIADEASFELSSLIIGILKNPVDINIHIALTSTLTILYSFNEGFSCGITTYVCNCLGERKVNKAKRMANVGFFTGMAVTGVLLLLMIIFKKQWVEFYSDDPIVRNNMTEFIWMVVIVTWLDVLMLYLGGILKALNEQTFTFFIVFAGIFIETVLGYILGITYEYNLVGVWIGTITGLAFTVGVMIVQLLKVDWYKEVDYLDDLSD